MVLDSLEQVRNLEAVHLSTGGWPWNDPLSAHRPLARRRN